MKQQSRNAILTVAVRLFSEHGYHATTMRSLAAAFPFPAGSLYIHVPSKEALLWEIVNQVAEALLSSASSISRDLPVETQFTRLIEGHLRIMLAHRDAAMVYIHEWRYLSPSHRAQLIAKRNAYEAALRAMIEAGMAQQVFSVAESRIATQLVLDTLSGLIRLPTRDAGYFSSCALQPVPCLFKGRNGKV